MTTDFDIYHMRHALGFARRGLGRVAPNPSVGCVIVKDGVVIARGRTADGGRPHAETVAIQQAGVAAKGATAYVTLEPCAHQGQVGPCAEALVKAGIKRAVVACIDPDPRVSGRGIEILKAAGIEVVVGICETEARALNAGFFLKVTEARPFITIKMATARNGMVPRAQWITSEASRRHAHRERSMHDAILIGSGTLESDDPLLNVRIPGIIHKGVRIVLDTHLKIRLDSALVESVADYPLWVFYADDSEGRAATLQKAGVRLFLTGYDEFLKDALKKLAGEGITRLLVEGGPKIWASFIAAGLYDRLLWYRAPAEVNDGLPALPGGATPESMGLRFCETRALERDSLEIYEKPY